MPPPSSISDTKKALHSRLIIRYRSDVRPGDRFELWDTPENNHGRYVVIYIDQDVDATTHRLEGMTENQARNEFEKLVEAHYDLYV